MKTDLTEFSNNAGWKVRSLVRDDAPWFVAKDVCDVLGIANHRDATSVLDDDERDDVGIADAIGRNQATTLVSESGLYALIFRSRKAEARAFRRWVTGEVLPAIRREGGYRPQSEVAEDQRERLRLAILEAQVPPPVPGHISVRAFLAVADLPGTTIARQIATACLGRCRRAGLIVGRIVEAGRVDRSGWRAACTFPPEIIALELRLRGYRVPALSPAAIAVAAARRTHPGPIEPTPIPPALGRRDGALDFGHGHEVSRLTSAA